MNAFNACSAKSNELAFQCGRECGGKRAFGVNGDWGCINAFGRHQYVTHSSQTILMHVYTYVNILYMACADGHA